MREEEKKQSSRNIGIQRFFKKRWVYPAVYILAAAIILSSFLWFQSRDEDSKDENPVGYEEHSGRGQRDGEAVETGTNVENFKWPVSNVNEVEVVTPFYDAAKSAEEQEAAILYYGNSFQPNTGIAIRAKNGETFNVLAAMSGQVKLVEQDSVLGNIVVIEHADGIETRYQALSEVLVKKGDKVNQGQVIGKAGQSLINQDAGIHVHFEIRNNDVPVNPLDYFEKSLTTLQDANNESKDESNNRSDEEKSDEENSGDSSEDEKSDDANNNSGAS